MLRSLCNFVAQLIGATSRTQHSPRSPQARPRLECLEGRVCPFTATWTNATGDWLWANELNWSWDRAAFNGEQYPGDDSTRTLDEVLFDGTSNTACSLEANLAAPSLHGFKVDTGYTNQ